MAKHTFTKVYPAAPVSIDLPPEEAKVTQPVAEELPPAEAVDSTPAAEVAEKEAEVAFLLPEAAAPVADPLPGVKDESTPVQAPEAAAPVAPTPVETPVPEAPKPVVFSGPEESEEKKYLDKIRLDGTEEQKRMLAAIETFTDRMKPRVELDPDKCTSYQHEFLRHLLWAVEKDYEVFRSCWSVLLVYFAEHHGNPTAATYTALSEYSTHRYLHNWKKGEDQERAYRGLMTLLRVTRFKDTRKHNVKSIDLGKVAPNVLSEKGLANLKKFYGV